MANEPGKSTPRATTIVGRFTSLQPRQRVIVGVVMMGISLLGISISPDPGDADYKDRMIREARIREERGGGGLVVPERPRT